MAANRSVLLAFATRAFFTALLLMSFAFHSSKSEGQELSGVKMRTCGPKVCSRLDTDTLYRSNLSMHIMAFAKAKLEISDPKSPDKVTQTIEAEDGYFDMQSQVIVMRGLIKSIHKELIFSLVDGKFIYF